MSMNCHFTVAYGIAGTGEPPEALGFNEGYADFGPTFVASTGGDQCSGLRSWHLVLSESRLRCDHRGDTYELIDGRWQAGSVDVVNVLKEPKTKPELDALLEKLGIDAEPSWLFLKDIL